MSYRAKAAWHSLSANNKLRIKHSFMCLPDDNWETLTVNPHPVAWHNAVNLMQHPKLKNSRNGKIRQEVKPSNGKIWKDTPLSAPDTPPICNGMKVLEEGIETNKQLTSRVLCSGLTHESRWLYERSKVNKANIVFLPTTKEACRVFYLFFLKINLTKIQSLPDYRREWEYLFYVDVIFNDYLDTSSLSTPFHHWLKNLKY